MSEQPQARRDVVDAMGFVFGEYLRIELSLLKGSLDAGSVFRNSQPKPPPSGGCYQASFGRVHVRPGCHCPR